MRTSSSGRATECSRCGAPHTERPPLPPPKNAARDARAAIGPEYAAAKAALPTDLDRKRFFDGILTHGLLTMLRDGRAADAQAMVREECVRAGVRLADPVRPRADAQQSAIA